MICILKTAGTLKNRGWQNCMDFVLPSFLLLFALKFFKNLIFYGYSFSAAAYRVILTERARFLCAGSRLLSGAP